MGDDNNTGKEWLDPRCDDVVTFFANAVQRTAARRGAQPCNICHGLRVIVMALPATKRPFKVPCSGCNPGGV